MEDSPIKYLYQNPESGVYTGFWACSRPHGKYVGIWPGGLIERVFFITGKPKSILEPFGGISKLGISIDLNINLKPTIVGDAQYLPIKSNSFDMVLMDPPYEQRMAKYYSELHQKNQKIKFGFYKALYEGARVTKQEGHLVILHTLIPKYPDKKRFKRIATIGISTGPNKRIRCLSIFKKFK